MTDLRNAAKMALEALEEFLMGDLREIKAGSTIDVLKRALADDISQERVDKAEEQRHEPVAMRWDFDGYGYRYIDSGSGSNWQTRVKDAEPLYDRPQQCPNCASLMEQNTELDKKLAEWVGLTEEDFFELAPVWFERETSLIDFVAMVEAKLKEKNR